jgi:hypothetical protein
MRTTDNYSTQYQASCVGTNILIEIVAIELWISRCSDRGDDMIRELNQLVCDPIKTIKTAQYAAVAAKTSCRFAIMSIDIVAAKMRLKIISTPSAA